MSKAMDMLNGLTDEEIVMYASSQPEEGHIVINSDRSITVPYELRRIGVQYDHNIETVEFDCPRYWDDHDMSRMAIYINYKRPDNHMGSYPAYDIRIDDTDPNMMHFKWTVEQDVTEVKGKISILVCVNRTNDDGIRTNHWSSELCTDMYISEGMECSVPDISDTDPDLVSAILRRLNLVEQQVVSNTAAIEDNRKNIQKVSEDLNTLTKNLSLSHTIAFSNNGNGVARYNSFIPAGTILNVSVTGVPDTEYEVIVTYSDFEHGSLDSYDTVQSGSSCQFCTPYDCDDFYVGVTNPDSELDINVTFEGAVFITKVVGDIEQKINKLHPATTTIVPSVLSADIPYNFGEQTELSLIFPTIADDGDVIYITFESGETATNLTVDTTNTSDFDLIPEPNIGYEIYAKYNGSIWIVKYSDYTVTEVS